MVAPPLASSPPEASDKGTLCHVISLSSAWNYCPGKSTMRLTFFTGPLSLLKEGPPLFLISSFLMTFPFLPGLTNQTVKPSLTPYKTLLPTLALKLTIANLKWSFLRIVTQLLNRSFLASWELSMPPILGNTLDSQCSIPLLRPLTSTPFLIICRPNLLAGKQIFSIWLAELPWPKPLLLGFLIISCRLTSSLALCIRGLTRSKGILSRVLLPYKEKYTWLAGVL